MNPNTVQKAYKLMEEEGFVVTDGNKPSTLRVTPDIRSAIETQLTRDLVLEFIRQAKQNNLTYQKTIRLLSELWED